MEAPKKFIWLLDNGIDRSGRKLIKNQEHNTADHGEARVAEWIKTGAACPPVETRTPVVVKERK